MIWVTPGSGLDPIDWSRSGVSRLHRKHLYEGYTARQATETIREVVEPEDTVVLTCAAGAVRHYPIGTIVNVSDHLNLTADSPLAPFEFLDCLDLYEKVPGMPVGVYAQMRGPQYETRAEIAMLRGLGADLAGMSTAIEALAAKAQGARVYAFAVVTNICGQHVSHDEVLAVAPSANETLREIINTL